MLPEVEKAVFLFLFCGPKNKQTKKKNRTKGCLFHEDGNHHEFSIVMPDLNSSPSSWSSLFLGCLVSLIE